MRQDKSWDDYLADCEDRKIIPQRCEWKYGYRVVGIYETVPQALAAMQCESDEIWVDNAHVEIRRRGQREAEPTKN